MTIPRVLQGDMLVELPKLHAAGERFHACVTDPPYHLTNRTPDVKWCSECHRVLGGSDGKPDQCPKCGGKLEYQRSQGGRGFMGKQWDGGDIAFRPETWRAVYDVLLPGAYLVAFASTRGYHRMVCAIEDAGFVIHPMLMWITGQGFAKATDASKQIDRHLGGVREIVGPSDRHVGQNTKSSNPNLARFNPDNIDVITKAATPEAAAWEGWKYGLQSLKPSVEPIALCQRPMEGTGAQNILKHGVGALNIGASRVPGTWARDSVTQNDIRGGKYVQGKSGGLECEPQSSDPAGRYPANLIHDGSPEVMAAFAAFGETTSGILKAGTRPIGKRNTFGNDAAAGYEISQDFGGDSGSPARFFTQCQFTPDELRLHYSSKADAADRADSKHPTVKPQSLLRWLTRLVCPPGGHILDPFAGTGSTGEACMVNGFDCTMIEADAGHARDIEHRVKRWSGGDLPMFAPVAADPQDERFADLFATPPEITP